jgi:hypothetical protein
MTDRNRRGGVSPPSAPIANVEVVVFGGQYDVAAAGCDSNLPTNKLT